MAAQHLNIVGAVAQGLGDGFGHDLTGLLEQCLRLGRIDPAPGLDHRRAAELVLLPVDRDHGHDDAFFGQFLPVTEDAVLNVTHGPVHVDVPAGHLAVA